MSYCMTFLESDHSLLVALFLAGLVGGFTHCTGMCAPFVLGQVSARLGAIPTHTMREWHRLQGAALLPYHLGRLTTYTMLGVVMSWMTLSLESGLFHRLATMLLLLAAALFISMALGVKWRNKPFLKLSQWLTKELQLKNKSKILIISSKIINKIGFSKTIKKLYEKPTGVRGYFLGFLLGFLPCGLVYASLAAATASGDVVVSALAMMAFSVGTMPALWLVGYGSQWLLKHSQFNLTVIARLVMALNAVMLIVIALK